MNTEETLKMQTKYSELDLNVMLYHITLSDKRMIKVYIHIRSISQIIPFPSKYVTNDEFQMEEVFIGEKEPRVQASTKN